jgi:uncharacterized membrane protein
MNWNLRRDLFPLVLLVLFGIGAFYFYPGLPDMIPSHFNMDGIPDSFSPKSTVVWINIAVAILLYLVLTFIPLVDPFWKKIQHRYNIFLFFRDVVIAFLLFIFVVIVYSAKEGRLQDYILGIGLGFLFLVIGNYSPRLPRNFFFGIRSPWTLASEVVWRRTHQVGGWLFVLVGVIIVILSLLKVKLGIVLLSTLLPVILFIGILYPLLLYKKLEKEGKLTL